MRTAVAAPPDDEHRHALLAVLAMLLRGLYWDSVWSRLG
jgi:hypothetical protein